MKTLLRSFAITASVVVIATGAFAAPRRAVRAHAQVERVDGAIHIPVVIDLTGVEVNSTPAVLGAYLVRAQFDPTQVRFVGAAGGKTTEFSNAPVTTAIETANQQGWVKVLGLQSSLTMPVGVVSVASLQFEELVAGGSSSIKLFVDQAVASPTPDSHGNIPKDLELPIARQNQ